MRRSLSQRIRAIKGPGLRIDLDVRRVWECSRCGRQRKYSGDVVARLCHCSAEDRSDGVWMHLIEPRRIVRTDRPRTVHEVACDELDCDSGSATPDSAAQTSSGNGQDRPADGEPEAVAARDSAAADDGVTDSGARGS